MLFRKGYRNQSKSNKTFSNKTIVNQIEIVSRKIIECFQNDGSVYFCGNGGSAADAQHLAAELSGKFYMDRNPLSAEALHCNTSFLTAVANDYSYDEIYARLIGGIGRKGDILFGLSTSGNSKNILKAIEKAKEKNIFSITLTGDSGGKMKESADICICIPSDDTPRIQEAHITIGHIICEIVEESIFSKKTKV
ncbi:MAG: SIS domain-containing protein [Dysgonomonas sp.]